MTNEERGQQVWQVLVSAARNRQILTYGLLAELIGMGPGTLAAPLGCVMFYCDQNDLPPLTVLVVRKGGGKPGTGLTTTSENLDMDRERVFKEEWFKRIPPSAAEFARARKKGLESG